MSQKKIRHATFNKVNIAKINDNFEELYGREGGGGIGDVGEITTDQIATNPDVLFRDSKGRFKSTNTVPKLDNQLEVNRWFLEQLESIEPVELPEMASDATPDTLVLRDGNADSKFNLITAKSFTFTNSTVSSNKADTWFLSGGETSAGSVKKNDAEGMRSSLDVYSKSEVQNQINAIPKPEQPFFTDIGSNTIEYFGDELWVTALREPFFIGAKIGNNSSFSGTVTANKFVGDGSALTGTVSAEVLVDAFESLQLAVSAETTVAGLKSALVVTLGSLIEQLRQTASEE